MSERFLPVAEPDLGELEEEFLVEAIRSGWVSSLGSFITRFESEFAQFCNATHAASVSNGTAALHLALVVRGIGAGDEVIIPSLTFVATASAVVHAGATPVFVDCEPKIGCMDPEAVEKAITERTKAIIAVHLYGHPADMDTLAKIANSHGILLVEDAAEAHGAHYKGKPVGSLADMAAFSFYGNKLMTTGEGGMIVSKSAEDDSRIRFLRDHAMDPNRRYWHPEIGFNYRITNLQAALGVAQLERFEELTKKRASILEKYRLYGLEEKYGIDFNPRKDWATPTPWLVCPVLPEDASDSARDAICEYLRDKKIDTRPYFIPIHEMPWCEGFRRVASDGSSELSKTHQLSQTGFNLPSSTNMSDEDIGRVAIELGNALERFL